MTQQQKGYLYQSHGAWYVRYRQQVYEPDGSIASVQRSKRLASTREFPKKSEVVQLRNEFMAKLNRVGFTPEAGVSLVDFVENVYFPRIAERLAASTVRGYREAWRCHLRQRVDRFRARDFRTTDGETLMRDIERDHGTDLAHASYRIIKVTLSAIFTHAKRIGVVDHNPIHGVSVPRGKKHGRKRFAYSLEEIEMHLDLFSGKSITVHGQDGGVYTPEVSAATVRALIAVAAFAGLRHGEIRGLWWEDDEDDRLTIRRSVWRTQVKDTKTHEDEENPGVVPIIRPLRVLLDAIRPANAYGWIFPNSVGGALDLANIAERVIKPVFKANGLDWKGWHAYRRGLATNLKKLGVPDTTIQAILRHESVSTTQRFYIKTAREDAMDAMKKFEEKLECAAVVQQMVN